MSDISSSINFNENGEYVRNFFVGGAEVTKEEYEAAIAKFRDDRAKEAAASQTTARADRVKRNAAVASARTKLKTLGLTDEEIAAIFGG
jgi:hypothetical protein